MRLVESTFLEPKKQLKPPNLVTLEFNGEQKAQVELNYSPFSAVLEILPTSLPLHKHKATN